MQRLESPPKMNVFLLIIISFFTFGIYIPVWFLIRKAWLNRLSATKKLGSGLAIFVLVIYVIAIYLLFVPLEMLAYETWEAIDNLITLVGGVCLLILAFQVRRILIQHYDENLGMNIGFSGAGTFFFNIWYLQYKMNRLPISAETSGDLA